MDIRCEGNKEWSIVGKVGGRIRLHGDKKVILQCSKWQSRGKKKQMFMFIFLRVFTFHVTCAPNDCTKVIVTESGVEKERGV